MIRFDFAHRCLPIQFRPTPHHLVEQPGPNHRGYGHFGCIGLYMLRDSSTLVSMPAAMHSTWSLRIYSMKSVAITEEEDDDGDKDDVWNWEEVMVHITLMMTI